MSGTFLDFARRHGITAFTETADPIDVETFVLRQRNLSGLKESAKGRGEFWANRYATLRPREGVLRNGAEILRLAALDGVVVKGVAGGRLKRLPFDDLDVALGADGFTGVEAYARPDRRVTGVPEAVDDDPLGMRYVGGCAGRDALSAALTDLALIAAVDGHGLRRLSITPLAPRCHGRFQTHHLRGTRERGGGFDTFRRAFAHVHAMYEPATQSRGEHEHGADVPVFASSVLRAVATREAAKARTRLAELLEGGGASPELVGAVRGHGSRPVPDEAAR